MTRESFVFYVDWEEAIDNINDPETELAYYRAIVKYALHGIEPGESLKSLGITMAMRQMDRDYAKYLEQKARSRRAGKASAAKRLSEYAAEEAQDAQPEPVEPQPAQPQPAVSEQAAQQPAQPQPAPSCPPADPQPQGIPAADQAVPSPSADQEEAYLQQYFSEAEDANRGSLLRMLNQQCPDITTHEHLRMLADRVIQRWRRNGKLHNDYRDFSTHLDSSLLQMSANNSDISSIIKPNEAPKKQEEYDGIPEWFDELMKEYGNGQDDDFDYREYMGLKK